jgi:hypothetical protein
MTLEGKEGLRIRKYFCVDPDPGLRKAAFRKKTSLNQCCGARIGVDFGRLDLDPNQGGQK